MQEQNNYKKISNIFKEVKMESKEIKYSQLKIFIFFHLFLLIHYTSLSY